jgi:broad specificity phosphatase PhoE
MEERLEIWLVRHGETEWSVTGAHTGITEVPLTDRGRSQAAMIGRQLEGKHFVRVLTSPRERAKDTCRLAGFGNVAEIEDGIQEWNYGSYEGKTTSEIRQVRPEWSIWRDGVPDGETIDQVATRAKKIIVDCERGPGPVLLFSHAHFLRVLAACWLGLPAEAGRLFGMDVASLSVLGYERENRVIRLWNDPASPMSHRRVRALGSNGEKSRETKVGR